MEPRNDESPPTSVPDSTATSEKGEDDAEVEQLVYPGAC